MVRMIKPADHLISRLLANRQLLPDFFWPSLLVLRPVNPNALTRENKSMQGS